MDIQYNTLSYSSKLMVLPVTVVVVHIDYTGRSYRWLHVAE
jgi:hypothetical protein